MDVIEKVTAMVEENNGFITSAQITDAGVQRRVLGELVAENKLYKAGRGIYVSPDAWEDEMFFLQYRFSKGVFSNETALYLHGLSDRTPAVFTMTFPHGYNAYGVKKSGISVKFTKPDNYALGVTEAPSPCGNMLTVYDKERTLCDIVKGNNSCGIEVVNQAMKTYAASIDKNIGKLVDYAERLRVKQKIIRYMEVLL